MLTTITQTDTTWVFEYLDPLAAPGTNPTTMTVQGVGFAYDGAGILIGGFVSTVHQYHVGDFGTTNMLMNDVNLTPAELSTMVTPEWYLPSAFTMIEFFVPSAFITMGPAILPVADIVGTDANEAFKLGADDFSIDAGGGDDRVRGGNKDEEIDGGAGNDFIKARGGNDTVDGGLGDDEIRGDGGNDSLTGGSGDDILSGGSGDDDLYGGDDNDTVMGGTGEDIMHGGDGDDLLKGGDDDDVLLGGAGQDRLQGGNNDDTLNGGDNNDRLEGGDGADTIYLVGGSDTAFGNAGADIFVFDQTDTGGAHRIVDFNAAEDILRIENDLGALTGEDASMYFFENAAQVGNHVVFDDGTFSVELRNTSLDELGPEAFGLLFDDVLTVA